MLNGFIELFASIDIVEGLDTLGREFLSLLNRVTTDDLRGTRIPTQAIDTSTITPQPTVKGKYGGSGVTEIQRPHITQTGTDQYGRPIGLSDEEIARRKSAMRSGSMTVVDEQAMLDIINGIQIPHVLSMIAIGVVSIVAEVASIGVLKKVIDVLQSLYSMTDYPSAYYELQKARIETSIVRPYRFWLEQEHQNNLPPPADLGRMLAREQLSAQDYDTAMGMWGYSPYWGNVYRMSRFVELDKTTIYEAFHRGLLDEAERDRLLRIADYNPQQLDLLSKLSYDLPNRTELRLMVRRTDIPSDLIDKALDAEGLAPEYKPYLIKMLDNWNVESAHTLLRSETLSQYEQGMINADEFARYFKSAGHSDDEVRAFLDVARLRHAGRRVTDRVRTIRRAFIQGLLTVQFEYKDELEAYDASIDWQQATSEQVYRAFMYALGFDEIDTEIMLDEDKIKSKNVDTLERLDEFLTALKTIENFEE